jgi:hypothetical protein
MRCAEVVKWISKKFVQLVPTLDERSRRRWAAVEASSLGHGGVTAVSAATGISRSTIHLALRELHGGRPTETSRIRGPGGGRKRLGTRDPDLLPALKALVEDTTRGDPQSPLLWTCKSVRMLAVELGKQDRCVSHRTVATLLREAGFTLQGNRKTREGASHRDRDAQFRHISRQVRAFQGRGNPVISVDTKKKELVGEFKNGGREWRPKGQPEKVKVHDFRDDDVSPLGGKAIPYGVYDLAANAGWVNVGIDHDTPDFAVQSIRTWWRQMGSRSYPKAGELLITADCGGSNGYRPRAWKVALQKLANETRLRICVCHFPPGTSKWNKIEHRMFCHITQNWRGRPLVSHEVIVNLIGSTTTKTGLKVRAKLDKGSYPLGVKVDDADMARLRIEPASFHGEWNYAITPE